MIRIFAALFATALGLMACTPPPEVTGRAIFLEHCVACHGEDGRGAAGMLLADTPPDLTGITDRNGGTFPLAEVISQIDGYTRIREGRVAMPEFGLDMDQGDLILIDTGDGIMTPTPERLVALAEYLRTIQE